MSASRRLSAADAAWLRMDRPTNLMVINSVLLFAEPVDWRRLKRIVQRRLIERYPRFRERTVESRLPLLTPSWEPDPDFALDHHLHHLALPDPGDTRALQELLGELAAMPLDRARPLWSMYLLDGFQGGSAVIARMHHCIADGIALAQVLLSLTDSHPGAPIDSTGHTAAPSSPATRWPAIAQPFLAGVSLSRRAVETVAEQGLAIATRPGHAVELAGALANDAATALRLLLTPADAASAIKGAPGVTRHVAWTAPLPLQLVRQIAHDHDATVNDVLLAAVSGALRRYLQRRGGAVGEIQALVPFNLRPLDEPVPRELGNRFGLVYLPLPVGTSGGYRRLLAVHRRMDAIKRSRSGPVSYGLLSAVGMTPTRIERWIVDTLTGKSTAVMTNVPGPQKPVYLAGVPVRSVLVWAPTSGRVGMSVSVFSYHGEVTVGLMVDSAHVQDPETIVVQIERELRALAKLKPSARGAGRDGRARAASR
ncbi:MAG TPA: wax ester/triacylglycerol synthase family O-acyltransferase [Solirubrobacteraceae bacterium]|nr:wax ester/triacylglycerol synthase family O-acyltransferase [Solirubrobacteraceae bacterium]